MHAILSLREHINTCHFSLVQFGQDGILLLRKAICTLSHFSEVFRLLPLKQLSVQLIMTMTDHIHVLWKLLMAEKN